MKKTLTQSTACAKSPFAGANHVGRKRRHFRQLMLFALLLLGLQATAQTNALNFDGSNDYVSLGSSITNLNDGDFTIEMWVKTTATNVGLLTCQNGDGSWDMGERCLYLDATGIPIFVGNWSGYIIGTVSVNDGNWHHIATTWDYSAGGGSVAKMYVDGADVTSGGTSYNNYAGNVGTFYLGKPNYGEVSSLFNGSMDEVRIWNVARTASQIASNYGCDIAQNANLLAYYRFNSGTAASSNSGLTSATDFSGNNKCGTLFNFALFGSTSNYVTGAIGSCNTITLVQPVTGTASVCVNGTTTLSDATTGGVWTSSNPAIASVGASTGIVTGVVEGGVTITYTVCGATATTTVTVNPLPTVAAITGNTTLSTAITTQLSDATSAGVWASGTSAVATVNSSTGAVTGVAAGAGIISYTVALLGCSTTVTTNVNVKTPNNGLNMGTGAYVLASGSNGYDLSNRSFTFESWIKRTDLGGDYFFGQGMEVTDRGLHVGFRSSSVFTFAFWNDDLNVNGSFGDNNWHHYAITFDDATLQKKVYQDGVLIGSGTATGHLTPGVSDLYIGTIFNGSHFNGSMDEVRLWNTVRTASEIQNSMNCDVAQSANLVLYYRFDQGVASGTNTGTTITSDYSGNNKCGTLTGFALTGTTSNFVTGAVGSCNAVTLVQAITGTASMCVGATTTLSDATTSGTWSSSNTTIASVNAATGVVTGNASGNATITYTVCGANVTRVVTVNAYPTVSAITGNTTLSTAITTTLADATASGVWASASTSIATVGSSTGVVSGVASGNATISYTVTTSGCATTVTTSVTVKSPLNAMKFDGTNDRIDGTNSLFPQGYSARTIEAWINPTTTAPTYQTIFNWGTFSANQRSGMLLFNNRLMFCGESNDYYSTVATVPANTWTHVAITFNGTTLKFYINGVLKESGILAGVLNTTGSSWAIGNTCNFASPRDMFNGSIDEVKVWNTERTVAEIQANMNCDIPQQTGLVAYYRFDQGTASGSNTNVNILNDYSGNNSCGTISNMALSGSTSNFVTGAVGNCNTITLVQPVTGTASVCVGATTTLNDATTSGTWSSSSPSFATVGSSTGIVTGVAAGTATITYRVCGVTATTVVTVNSYPTVAAITGNTTLSSTITTKLSDATSGGVWASGTSGIATVNSSTGVATGVAAGTGIISYTVTSLGCSTTVTTNVTVKTPNNGLSFDGADDYVSIATSPISTATSFTYEAWMYQRSYAYWCRIFDFGNFADYNLFITPSMFTTGNFQMALSVGAGQQTVTTPGPLPLNTWIHVAVTIGGGAARIYVNGELVAENTSFTYTPATMGATTRNYIGKSQYVADANFNGVLDEVRVWNVARTQAQIQANMNCDVSQQTGLVAYYRFDQGSAAGSNSGLTGAYDYSGNSNCATLNNFALSGSTSNYVAGAVGSCNAITLVQAITGSTSVCAGSTITLADATSGGSWSSSNTTIASVNASTGVVTGVSGGNATITYAVCGASVTVEVTVNPSPATIGGTAAVCMGSSTTLSNSVSGGAWTIADASIATIDAAGVVTPGSEGNTSVTYTLPAGCYKTVVLTVNPLPATITGAATVCEGLTTTFANTTTSGNWSSANTSVATVDATSGVVTGILAGNTTISYTLGTGCYIAATVTVNPSPAIIAGTAVVCMGSTTTLTNSVTGGSWTSSDDAIATIDASGVVTPVSDGNATISYTLPEGCLTTRELTVNPLPAAITGTTDMCMGNTTTLSSASAGGAWSSASPSTVTVNSSTGVVTSHNEGATTITYTLPTGCLVTSSVNNMVASIHGSTATCAGLNVTLSDATTGGAWSSSDATVAPINISGIVSATAAGGSAILSYTMPSGCYRTTPLTIVTTPPAITGTMLVCVGAATTMTNSVPGGTWSAAATAVFEGPSTDGVLTGMVAGTATLSYSLSPSCRTSVVITVNPAPQVITGTDRVCPGNTTTLATVSTGGSWSSSNALATIDPSTGVVTGVTAGTAVISYTFTSTGCSRTTPVTVNPAVPAITGPTSVCAGSTIALANSAPNGVSWSSSNTSVATVGMANGVVSGVSAGIATITFTTGTGCIATTNITVGSVPASTGASSVCIGSTTTLANAMTGGVWSSSNTAKATVDAAGVVTGVAEGPANIIYTAGGCSTTKAINVSPLPSVITGYTTACVGTTTMLTSVGNTGTWVSGTTSVATVGSVNGIVSGVSAGTSALTYTVTSTGCTRTATVTVVTAPTAITGTAAACAGSTATMSNTTVGGTWTSGATSVATIDAATGVVTAVAAGTATITYGFGSSCKVMASFTTRAMPAVIAGTASVCMPVVSTLTDATAGGTWTSSNTSVATVGSAVSAGSGVVSGVSTGTADITYTITSTGCFRTAQVTVNAGLNPGVISPSGTPRLRVVSAPHTMTFTTSGVAGGAWSSSNSAIATVDPSTGLVTGIAAGNATISYSINSGSCTNVAVKPMTVAAGRDGDNTVGGLTGINLYPNPTTGMFTLETEQAGNLVVFTIDGREVSSYSVEKGATQVFLPSGIAAGIYMCRFTTTDGSTTMIRLVYEH